MTRSVNRILTAAAFVTVLSSACAPPPPLQSAPAGGLVTLAPGQTSAAESEGLRVTFDRVVNDSRCPADVACIQAGEAVVSITVEAADRSRRSYELHTTGATSVVHAGLTIALEGLDPRPMSSRPVRPSDYRLTLRVGR